MEIKIRAFEASDTDSLMARFEGLKLFDRGRAYFEWSTSFRARQRIFLLACLDNAVIGYYNATMSWLKVGDKIINAYYGSILIHPDHRKKKYSFSAMSRLVKKLVDEVIDNQGVFYGFPNPRLGTYSNHANHTQPIKLIPRYVCVLRGRLFQPPWRWWFFGTKHRPNEIAIKEIRF